MIRRRLPASRARRASFAARRSGRSRRRALSPYPILVEHDAVLLSLDPRHDGVRIAHLSDVHAGRMTPAAHVRRAVELANAASPDVIVMTGDYVSWHRREIPIMAELLRGLSAAPVVVTLGNHDYFASGAAVAAAMSTNGYRVLRNEHVTLDVRGVDFHLVGIDDPVTRKHDVDRAFTNVPVCGTRVALCHCPEQSGAIAAHGAPLILSGHTHGGQIFVRGITDRVYQRMGRRYVSGFYPVEDSLLYVTAGVGFSGVRVRAGRGTRAEVALLTLRAAASAHS